MPSKIDAALSQRLWDLMLAEGRALGYEFSSMQVNLNLPGKPHRDRDDTNHQWCCSLGEFAGGRLCWLESDVEYKRDRCSMWTKLHTRHLHWVEPYEGVRYSLVLFSCTDHPALPLYFTPPAAARRRALVLFCGTGSVDRAFIRQGWEVLSVDNCAKYAPTDLVDKRQGARDGRRETRDQRPETRDNRKEPTDIRQHTKEKKHETIEQNLDL